MIEDAYELAEEAGLPLWCQDEAGPYQAIPQAGEDWHAQGKPTMQPHEYVRWGTAKLLPLFRPATGEVRAKGVLSAPNVVLHPWLQEELQAILDELDQAPLPVRVALPEDHLLQRTWQHWYWSYERPKPAPPLRLLLIWDNLAGHLSYPMVRWLLQHGILPLYTPLSGSWLYVSQAGKLDEKQRELITHIRVAHADLDRAYDLTQAFVSMLADHRDMDLESWLAQAEQSGIRELGSFAAGIRRDYAAVRAAFTSKWSNGPLEAQVNCLKLQKRIMFGRAKFDLLRLRVLRRA